MTKAIRANRYNDGRIEMIGRAVIDFDEEEAYAISSEVIETLRGWGDYTALVRLDYDPDGIDFTVYAVAF